MKRIFEVQIVLSVTLCALGSSVACDHGHDDHEAGHVHAAKDAGATQGEAREGHGVYGISLDDGKKWNTDEHTRNAAAGMLVLAVQDPKADLDAYKALGAELMRKNQAMINGCTMKGPAHDNLHAFLTRYIPALVALRDAESLRDGTAALAEVRETLDLYQEHFN